MANEVTLGSKYRDFITEIEGAAVSRTTYLYGCVRVCLEWRNKDGKVENEFFDEQRLVDVETQTPIESDATTGGDFKVPPARNPR